MLRGRAGRWALQFYGKYRKKRPEHEKNCQHGNKMLKVKKPACGAGAGCGGCCCVNKGVHWQKKKLNNNKIAKVNLEFCYILY